MCSKFQKPFCLTEALFDAETIFMLHCNNAPQPLPGNRAIGLSHWRPSGIYIGRFVEELQRCSATCQVAGGPGGGTAAAAVAAEEDPHFSQAT